MAPSSMNRCGVLPFTLWAANMAPRGPPYQEESILDNFISSASRAPLKGTLFEYSKLPAPAKAIAFTSTPCNSCEPLNRLNLPAAGTESPRKVQVAFDAEGDCSPPKNFTRNFQAASF